MCGLLWLAFFTRRNVFKIYPCCSISWLTTVPLDVQTAFLFFSSSVDLHLGSFYLLAIMNNDTINFCVSFCVSLYFLSLGYISRSGIAGSCSNFNFLKSFQSSFTIFRLHQQYEGSVSPHLYERLLFLFIIAILMSAKWYAPCFLVHLNYFVIIFKLSS